MIKRLLFILLTFLFGIYSSIIFGIRRAEELRNRTNIVASHHSEASFYIRIGRRNLHQAHISPTVALRIVDTLEKPIIFRSYLV